MLTRKSWLFNENYAKIVHLPVASVPVHVGNASDLSVLQVKANLPFQRILLESSGWVDLFFPPRNEWEKYVTETSSVNLPMFEYPIAQESMKERDTYSFKAYFSENNIASRISLVILPDYGITLFLLSFYLSPIYLPIYFYIQKKKVFGKSTLSKFLAVFAIYSVPLLGLLCFVLALFGYQMTLTLFSFIIEVTNPLVLALTLSYPALFFLVVSFICMKEDKKKTENIKISKKTSTTTTKSTLHERL
jgi:hypothetical protein